MLNKKRMLVSLGTGIFLFLVGLFSILLIWKLLNSPAWMTDGIVWMLAWPIRLLSMVTPLPYPERGGAVLALSVGAAADIAILTGSIYAALSRFRSKWRPPSPPPPPPAYH
jgi:hypothetical protein